MTAVNICGGMLRVSRMCLGCMQFSAMDRKAVFDLIDAYRDCGGNFFDTAHCYCSWLPSGAGSSESVLGLYIKERRCRDQVVLATKGGHPSMPNYRTVNNYLSRERVGADIDDSLGRLMVDRIDLYWLHRDDPGIDAGEIVEMMNDEVSKGRIRSFGASNWTSRRISEANDYAKRRGMQGFSASQPKWSLLEHPVMTQEERLARGVLLHMDDADRRWHTETQLPAVCYSPTGRGFFATGGRAPSDLIAPENTARAGRVSRLAEKKGRTPGQIALAWLLAQPFPVIPILGTSSVEHLNDAMAAEAVNLSLPEADALEHGGVC